MVHLMLLLLLLLLMLVAPLINVVVKPTFIVYFAKYLIYFELCSFGCCWKCVMMTFYLSQMIILALMKM